MGSINPVALRVIRECRGMTREQLANAIGMNHGSYGRIENGTRRTSVETTTALAKQLAVPIAAITNPHEQCPHCLDLVRAA